MKTGWEGGDMNATIDLVTPQNISSVSIHVLEQKVAGSMLAE